MADIRDTDLFIVNKDNKTYKCTPDQLNILMHPPAFFNTVSVGQTTTSWDSYIRAENYDTKAELDIYGDDSIWYYGFDRRDPERVFDGREDQPALLATGRGRRLNAEIIFEPPQGIQVSSSLTIVAGFHEQAQTGTLAVNDVDVLEFDAWDRFPEEFTFQMSGVLDKFSIRQKRQAPWDNNYAPAISLIRLDGKELINRTATALVFTPTDDFYFIKVGTHVKQIDPPASGVVSAILPNYTIVLDDYYPEFVDGAIVIADMTSSNTRSVSPATSPVEDVDLLVNRDGEDYKTSLEELHDALFPIFPPIPPEAQPPDPGIQVQSCQIGVIGDVSGPGRGAIDSKVCLGEEAFPYGRWLHYTFAYESSSRKVDHYLNGVLIKEEIVDHPFYNDEKILLFALDPNNGSWRAAYHFWLRNYRLFNRTLNSQEVLQIINKDLDFSAPYEPLGLDEIVDLDARASKINIVDDHAFIENLVTGNLTDFRFTDGGKTASNGNTHPDQYLETDNVLGIWKVNEGRGASNGAYVRTDYVPDLDRDFSMSWTVAPLAKAFNDNNYFAACARTSWTPFGARLHSRRCSPIEYPAPPWGGHTGGIFHITADGTPIKLTGGPYTAWDASGENKRKITEISAFEELVFITSSDVSGLFKDNSSGWEFGSLTDTSHVLNMDYMFSNTTGNIRNINDLDVSFVTSMNYTFSGSGNHDIRNWDVNHVTSFVGTFSGNSLFNRDIGGWRPNHATSMDLMFENASQFNQDLSNWCMDSIPSEPSNFAVGATNYVLPKPTWGGCTPGWIGHDGGIFHIKNVGSALRLKRGPYTAWDIDGTNERRIDTVAVGEELVFVTPPDCTALFEFARDVTWEFGDITDTSKVTVMDRMFFNCNRFNADISGWDTSSVTDMDNMFEDASNFNQDIGGWDTSNVTDMEIMFSFASNFNQDLSGWCVTNISSRPFRFWLGAGFEGQDAKQPCWGHCPRGENGTVDPCP